MATVSEKQLEEDKTYVFMKDRNEMSQKRERMNEENERRERRKVRTASGMIDGRNRVKRSRTVDED